MRGIVSLVFSLAILSACAVKSDQMDLFLGRGQGQADLSPYYWQFSKGERTYPMLAVTAADKTLFVNEQGPFVIFDGWMIEEISGFPAPHGAVLVVKRADEYILSENNRTYKSFSCGDWSVTMSNNGAKTFIQNCSHGQPNEITVGSGGQITRISQFMGDEFWVLEKK